MAQTQRTGSLRKHSVEWRNMRTHTRGQQSTFRFGKGGCVAHGGEERASRGGEKHGLSQWSHEENVYKFQDTAFDPQNVSALIEKQTE